MNRKALVVAMMLAIPVLAAQEEKKAPAGDKPASPAAAKQQDTAQANPKQKEHEALKALVGTWEVTHKMTEAGGTPKESKGTERAELICNGLWLKSTVTGEHEGQPFTGVWLLGYDPHGKTYKGIWVDNFEQSPSTSTGRYDEKAKTWHFDGNTSQGRFTTTTVIKDPDTIVETGTCTADGKESKLEVTRKRAGRVLPVEASISSPPKAPTKEHAELLKAVGEWSAVMKAPPEPGAPPTETKGNEQILPICDGRYTWSTFKMQWAGQPFEGHALCGYDSEQKKYVNFWIDSMNPVVSETTGTYDPSTKTLTLTGSTRDQDGKPIRIKEVITWKDEDSRHMKMEFQGDKTESFEIAFERK
jgi:hypothetical protein